MSTRKKRPPTNNRKSTETSKISNVSNTEITASPVDVKQDSEDSKLYTTNTTAKFNTTDDKDPLSSKEISEPIKTVVILKPVKLEKTVVEDEFSGDLDIFKAKTSSK